MRKSNALRTISGALLLAAAAGPFAACSFDDTYDLDKDIDLTMGLGGAGLQMKLGNTEVIHLASLLETTETVTADDVTHLYCLSKSGSTSVSFSVDKAAFDIDNAKLTSENTILTYDDIYNNLSEVIAGITVPRDPISPELVEENMPTDPQDFSGEDAYNFDVKNIAAEVTELNTVTPASGTKASFKLRLQQSAGLKFTIAKVQDLVLTFPSYIKAKGAVDGKYTFNTANLRPAADGSWTFEDINIELIDVPTAQRKVGADRRIALNGDIKMSGKLTLGKDGNFSIKDGDEVHAILDVTVGTGQVGHQTSIDVASVNGIFNPDIAPDDELINVGDDLPDYLSDDDVVVKASNPTIYLQANMANIPADIKLSATVDALYNGSPDLSKQAVLEEARLTSGRLNELYYSQQAQPFTGGKDVSGAIVKGNQHLAQLVEKVPDDIRLSMKNGQVVVVNEPVDIELGREYSANLDYVVSVPFIFDKGFTIVYSDSITDINKDIKDYAAPGAIATATVENAVPLEMEAGVEPLDVNGRVIEGAVVETDVVAPAEVNPENMETGTTPVASPIKITITFAHPDDLKKLDKFVFRIKATQNVDDVEGELRSSQYIQVKDLRLKLTGKVTANFN